MQSLLPSAGPSTRASSARAIQIQETAPVLSLSLTPLQELTVEDEMDHEMIWEQMELRSTAVVELLEEMFGGEKDGSRREGDDGEDEDEVESSGELEDESEEDSDQIYGEEDEDDSEQGENTPFEEAEYLSTLTTAVPHPSERRTKSKSKSSTSDSDSDEEEETNAREPADLDPTSALTLSSFDDPSSTLAPRGRKASGPPSAVDSGFFSLHDFHVQTDEGEFEMAKALRGEFDEEDDEDDGVDLFAAVGGSDDEDLDNAGSSFPSLGISPSTD